MNGITGHLYLFLYVLASISGTVALVRFHFLYAETKKPLYKHYLYFLYAYSGMIAFSLITLYIETNLVDVNLTIRIMYAGILISAHLLSYTLPQFLSITQHTKTKRFPLWLTQTPLWLLPVNLLFALLSDSKIPVFLACTLFSITLLISLAGLFQSTNKNPISPFIINKIRLFVLIVIMSFALEFALTFFISSNEFSLSMPFIYLSWNLISLSVIPMPKITGKTLRTVFNLTSQEEKIAYLMSQALSNKEIAAKLSISPHTVKNHVTNILKKTQSSGRMELIRDLQQRQ